MKIIYGKDSCILQGSNIVEVVIKYRGDPYLSHNHLEIIEALNDNQAYVKNINSSSLILHGNNQIHIGWKNAVDGEVQLFRYTGYFKILSAKVNGKNITIETKNIDFWNLIDSKWDSAGKPELYKGTYRNGIGVRKKKRMKRISRKSSTTATRTITGDGTGSGTGGGY